MIVLTCVDDKNGVGFNHRRQSQDRILRDRLLQLCSGKVLHMNAYSAELFVEQTLIQVSERFLEEASPGELCFAEGVSLKPYETDIEKLILFRWNRHYPADVFLDLSLTAPHWRKTGTVDFAGSSHPNITMETYEK